MKFILPPDKMAHLCETLLDEVARLREDNERLQDEAARHHMREAGSFTVPHLKCAGCGLEHGDEYPNEPTVTLRAGGVAMCADCAAKAKGTK